jgi:chromosome segregation ATPase
LETNVGVLEGRLEESNMQLKSALKKFEESQSKMIKLDVEATSLREELSEKIDERNEAEYQLESLRQE